MLVSIVEKNRDLKAKTEEFAFSMLLLRAGGQRLITTEDATLTVTLLGYAQIWAWIWVWVERDGHIWSFCYRPAWLRDLTAVLRRMENNDLNG